VIENQNTMKLPSILKFIGLTHGIQQVRRTILVNGEERNENDVEHQYQLAMLAWYIIDTEHILLDRGLAMQYALVHDIVEVYAGDTYFLNPDIEDKVRREAAAAEQLKSEFPEFTDLHILIDGYERRKDPESRFIYALDKLLPVLNIYLDQGRTWKSYGVTEDMLLGNKREKIAASPEVNIYFEELIVRLREEEPDLFFQSTHTIPS